MFAFPFTGKPSQPNSLGHFRSNKLTFISFEKIWRLPFSIEENSLCFPHNICRLFSVYFPKLNYNLFFLWKPKTSWASKSESCFKRKRFSRWWLMWRHSIASPVIVRIVASWIHVTHHQSSVQEQNAGKNVWILVTSAVYCNVVYLSVVRSSAENP